MSVSLLAVRAPRTLSVVVALLLAVTLLGLVDLATAPSARADDERRKPPVLTVTERSLGHGIVPRDVVGANQRWLLGADGAWDAGRNRIRTDTARLMRKVGLGTIRYSGGTIANIFDFRRSMGSKPGCQVSGGLLRPVFSSVPAKASGYTIGRHAQFLRAAGARTNLMIPMINQTPQDAVDYVKAVAKATGQRQFYVEVGNEPYLTWQRYWRSKDKRTRLDQYILGGSPQISDRGLYPVKGCNLAKKVRADGSSNQTYRTRYWPISTSRPPVVTVNGQEWTYASELGGLFGRTFTLSPERDRIIFNNGLLNLAAPRGDMRIRYSAHDLPGFVDFYDALKNIPGIDVDVCTAWAGDRFARRMDQLGEDYDCMAVHSYASFGGSRGGASEFRSSVASARRQVDRIADLRRSIRRSPLPGAGDRYLTVTEFGGEHRAHLGPRDGAFLREFVQAISLVGQLNQGVRVSNISNFQGLVEHYGKRVGLSGRAYLLSMVRRLVGKESVEVSGRKPQLLTTASRSGQNAALLVVNTSWDRARTVRIALSGRRGGTCVGVRTLSADPFALTRAKSPNGRPRSVRPARRALLSQKDAAFRHRLPEHSISLLTFSKRTPGRACPRVGPL